MLSNLLAKIFGSKNDRTIKSYSKIVQKINSFEDQLLSFSDEQLKNQTKVFRERLAKGEKLDDILPEAFATVREVSSRVMKMRHFDVQMMGGIALHKGSVAEMKTGEGKTLTATLPLYLNSLAGPAHLVTVNDYLAKRDAEWMKPIYEFLGLTVSFLQNHYNDEERRNVYASDIVYGTNSEFGFDYLRDNMKFSIENFVQRDLNFAIVDEVDSILIDEARTPLIISGPSEKSSDLYEYANQAVLRLSKEAGDYEVDEKARTVLLTEQGTDKVEQALNIKNLYAAENILPLHHVQQALKAHVLFKRDVDYMVNENNEVLIVDEFTGRALPGRRFSDGLHQAIEAKEGVEVEQENQTLATITLQNYFRMYNKLAGMTGTASTDAVEFHKIYNLDVVVIPTHRPMIRVDEEDVVYITKKAKYDAVVKDIESCYDKGQPVLVGTASIESSEYLSHLLHKRGIQHTVLNAKQHAREAEIVKEAGEVKHVTISTSMAGRGTDIKLGLGARDLGGLRVIATERYENRRIDDQLRGRSGRQGDPGSSKFYISLEDDLMRIFGGEQTKQAMLRFGSTEDESMESSFVSSIVKSNQEKLERYHFDIRKQLLEYDDVMNQQRSVIYSYRKKILSHTEEHAEVVKKMIAGAVENILVSFIRARTDRDYHNVKRTDIRLNQEQLNSALEILENISGVTKNELGLDLDKNVCMADALINRLQDRYEKQRSKFDQSIIDEAERWMLLNIIDYAWKAHLQNLDHLKEGIGLRGYGQKNPLYEYKKESFEEFAEMMNQVKFDIVSKIFKLVSTNISEQEIESIKESYDQEAAEVYQLKTEHGETGSEEKKKPKKASKSKDAKDIEHLLETKKPKKQKMTKIK